MRKKDAEGIFIPPKSDIVFKELMRNEEVRRHFISDVLDIPLDEIKSVRLENTFLSRRGKQEKQCILDVRMQLNDESRINVELQIRRMAYWDKRSLFYLAKMYTDGLDSGQRYDRLKKCVVIDILDFTGDENPGYHKVYHLRDKEGRLYSDQFEVHIIELNKELIGDELDDWIRLLRVENREELENMHSGNAGVTRAIEEVRVMNLSRRLRAWYDARQRDQRDRWAIEDAIKEDAYKEGHEKGHADGWATGQEAGRKAGWKAGEEAGWKAGQEAGWKAGEEAGWKAGQEAGQKVGQEIGKEIGKEIGQEIGKEIGQKSGHRQDIIDLLEDWGEVPVDIRDRIYAEEDAEVLRKWHKTAARTEGFDDFRAKM